MKSLLILFGLIFCLVSVSGRNLHDNLGNEEYSTDDSLKQARDPTANQMRHRRRSRQSYFDYNYHDYRRDHNRQQDESYNQIIRLLDEIASNLRRPPPPPPPQPIYVPYPVPYYVPQYIGCSSPSPNANNTKVPAKFPSRWPEMEDERQNFGLVPEETDTGDSDGARPISFDPIPPISTHVKPPPVEHGSTQAGMEDKKTTQVKQPGLCKAAVLTCCNFKNYQDQRSCFLKHDCRKTFETGHACKPEVVKQVLQEFAEAYAPITKDDRVIWPPLSPS